MRLAALMTCWFRGHRWTHSRTKPGYKTCKRCHTRREIKSGKNAAAGDRDIEL